MKTVKISTFLLAVSAMILISAVPGFANPCAQDVQQFCSDVPKGEGRIMNCLKEHAADLSAECQQSMDNGKAKIQAGIKSFQESCSEDMKNFCAEVEPGQGRVLACLKEHADQVSPQCQAVITKDRPGNK